MKIVLSASIALDRIMVYPGKFAEVIQPDKLHVLSISVLLDELKETRGGVAANIAYSLALLGENPVLYGSVGDNAREYMDDLAAHGVDTSLVHYSHLPTASFSVMTDKADCQIGGFYPGAMGDAASLTFEKWQPDEAFVVIGPHDPTQMKNQVAEVKARGLRMFYDVGQQVINIDSADLVAGVAAAELLIVNDYELGMLQEKSKLSLADILQQVKVLVVTLGAQGCEVYHQGKMSAVPAMVLTPDQVVDPTGAGDAFRAGFLYGYIRDWPLEACAKLGSVVASYAIQKVGTQEHTFTKEAISQLYKDTYQEQLHW